MARNLGKKSGKKNLGINGASEGEGLFGVEMGEWGKSPGKFPVFLGVSRGKLEIPQDPMDSDPRKSWKIHGKSWLSQERWRSLTWKHRKMGKMTPGKTGMWHSCCLQYPGIPWAGFAPAIHFFLGFGHGFVPSGAAPALPLSRIPWKRSFRMLPGRSFGIRISLWTHGI